MIEVDCVQGTHEWLMARLGRPTASNFHKIITPKTRKPSKQSKGYRNQLLVEWLYDEPTDNPVSQYMERGSELEQKARQRFEVDYDMDIVDIGFCVRDDRLVGCSPDGLLGDDGGIEIKNLSAANHIGALIDGDDDDHIAQIQGCMFVTGRKWWVRMYYHPDFPPIYIRLERDEEFIADLEAAIYDAGGFLDQVDRGRKRLIGLGCIPRRPAGAAAA